MSHLNPQGSYDSYQQTEPYKEEKKMSDKMGFESMLEPVYGLIGLGLGVGVFESFLPGFGGRNNWNNQCGGPTAISAEAYYAEKVINSIDNQTKDLFTAQQAQSYSQAQQMNDLQRAIDACCCNTNAHLDRVSCDITNTINASTNAILAKLNQQEFAALTKENAALREAVGTLETRAWFQPQFSVITNDLMDVKATLAACCPVGA